MKIIFLILIGVIVFYWFLLIFKILDNKKREFKVFSDDEYTYTTRFEDSKVNTNKIEDEDVKKIFNERERI